mmetsp:Transcript_3614/g.5973  ORF Transcript_3614/g.5973 Transcript_3614/m.5973 type:complete len:257 (+) Transcript_3614:294-1064(+)
MMMSMKSWKRILRRTWRRRTTWMRMTWRRMSRRRWMTRGRWMKRNWMTKAWMRTPRKMTRCHRSRHRHFRRLRYVRGWRKKTGRICRRSARRQRADLGIITGISRSILGRACPHGTCAMAKIGLGRGGSMSAGRSYQQARLHSDEVGSIRGSRSEAGKTCQRIKKRRRSWRSQMSKRSQKRRERRRRSQKRWRMRSWQRRRHLLGMKRDGRRGSCGERTLMRISILFGRCCHPCRPRVPQLSGPMPGTALAEGGPS